MQHTIEFSDTATGETEQFHAEHAPTTLEEWNTTLERFKTDPELPDIWAEWGFHNARVENGALHADSRPDSYWGAGQTFKAQVV